MNVLDGIFVFLITFSILRGYKKGLFGTISKVGGFLFGLVAAVFFYRKLADYLSDQWQLEAKLSPLIAEKLFLPAIAFKIKISDFSLDKASISLQQLHLPKFLEGVVTKQFQNVASLPEAKGFTTIGEAITYTVSHFLVNVFSFMGLLLCVVLIFWLILPRLFSAVSPTPVTILDKLGGAFVGLGFGVLSTIALGTLLLPASFLGAINGNPSSLANQLHGSFMANFFMKFVYELL